MTIKPENYPAFKQAEKQAKIPFRKTYVFLK
jgi:hypothetical protein